MIVSMTFIIIIISVIINTTSDRYNYYPTINVYNILGIIIMVTIIMI